MQKLSTFVGRCLNANGPAQIVGYAVWGVVLAGMLWDFDPDQLYQELLFVWGATSLLVLVVAVWFSKRVLQYTLMFDMVLSMCVFLMYAMYDPTYATQMVYRVDAAGNFWKVEQSISCVFTMAALVWSVLHSAYLANLTQRQILEQERFRGA